MTLRLDPVVRSKIGETWPLTSDHSTWHVFSQLSLIIFSTTRIASQLFMVISLLRKHAADPIFFIASILGPAISYAIDFERSAMLNKREAPSRHPLENIITDCCNSSCDMLR